MARSKQGKTDDPERPAERLDRIRPDHEDRRVSEQGAIEQSGEGGRPRPPNEGRTTRGSSSEDSRG